MKERPINFNSEMVKAILEGRKTQTRRVLKPQPKNLPNGAYCDPYNKNYEHFTFWTKDNKMILTAGGNIKNTAHWKCPHRKTGDRVWVRETWAYCGSEFHKDDYEKGRKNNCNGLMYKATSKLFPVAPYNKWRSPITMPRWASRITLEITDIRVERLQEIEENNCLNEGIKPLYDSEGNLCLSDKEGWENLDNDFVLGCYKSDFENLWNSLAKKGFKWEDNPWVWVIEFKRINA